MKHKKLTMVVALVLVVALAAGLGIWAVNAESIPTVTYYDGSDGTDAHFTFTNTGAGSDTNLFPNFSDCMPGDELAQTIRVQADSKNGVQGAKIYLRAETDGDASAKDGTAISYNDVLEHISMTVSKNGIVLASSKTAKLFTEPDAAEGMKNNVLVAEVYPKGEPQNLDVTISVDPAMGNAFQEAAAHITFVFSVEDNELPPPPLERKKHEAYVAGYPDGTVRPGNPITRAEVATIFFCLLQDDTREAVWSTKYSYPDVEPHTWYSDRVATMTNAGVMAGYPDGTFGPSRHITRAEFATVAARFFHAPEVSGDAFSDISGSWARGFINRAAALGLISGYPDGTFRPEQEITRAEVMTIINNVLFRTPDKEHFLPDMVTWPDNPDTPGNWSYEAVQEATNSHDYKRVDNKSPETWTKITKMRDWSAVAIELARKYPDR